MSKLIAARTAQTVLEAEFTFNFNDTMVNTAGNEVDFGRVNLGGAAGIFEVFKLPANATIIGGEVVTETAFDTAGFDVTVGDATTADRYLASADLKAAGRAAITPTGRVSDGEMIRVAFSSDDVCTTGKMTVRVQYVVRGRVSEVHV